MGEDPQSAEIIHTHVRVKASDRLLLGGGTSVAYIVSVEGCLADRRLGVGDPCRHQTN